MSSPAPVRKQLIPAWRVRINKYDHQKWFLDIFPVVPACPGRTAFLSATETGDDDVYAPETGEEGKPLTRLSKI
jgi:hypothetical protein